MKKNNEGLDFAVICPVTLCAFPAVLQPLLLWLPLLTGISDLQQTVLRFQSFRYKQGVLIIRDLMNQPKNTTHH